jgi:hypothetical protein
VKEKIELLAATCTWQASGRGLKYLSGVILIAGHGSKKAALAFFDPSCLLRFIFGAQNIYSTHRSSKHGRMPYNSLPKILDEQSTKDINLKGTAGTALISRRN